MHRLTFASYARPQPRAATPACRPLGWPPLKAGLAALAGLVLTAGCALPIQSARMALQPSLQAAPALPFDGLGAGRSGRFTLDGREVSFRRMGDALSLFERLQLDRVSVAFERAGQQGRCDGRAVAITAGIVDTPAKPLELSCRFSGPLAGELVLRETRLAAAGTRQAREGQARMNGGAGTLVIDVRSEHALAGSPLPLAQPAGYRLMMQGRDVAALDLAGGTPVLRHVAGLDDTTRAAVVQVALALGLLFDPALTLG
jgi:hypothetical protein